MAFIYDLVDPQELLGFVRNLDFPEFELAEFFPPLEVADLEYRFRRGNLVDQDTAPYRAFDAEAAIGSRQGLERVRGELPPISKKIRLGEEERLRLNALARNDDGDLVEQIYDDAAAMTRAIQARLEEARGQALWEGIVEINENGVQGEVDFGRDASMEPAQPNPLWSNAAATIIRDLRGWRQDYIDLNGVPPGLALTSSTVIGDMLLNNEIRQLAATVTGTPALVTEDMLGNVLRAYGLPPVRAYDTVVRKSGIATRTIPEDRLIFLPPAGERLGNTFYGITAEALELAEEGQIELRQAPGLVAVVDKTFDPVARWTKAAGIALPVMGNPDLTLSVDVR
jgi:hypothetical protein